MATASQQGWFAPKLATALEETRTSVRELARRMNGGDPESARRSLHRYLIGRVPSAETRKRIAELLGIDPQQLEPDADEEEDEASVLRLLAHKLIDRGQDDIAAALLDHVHQIRQAQAQAQAQVSA